MVVLCADGLRADVGHANSAGPGGCRCRRRKCRVPIPQGRRCQRCGAPASRARARPHMTDEDHRAAAGARPRLVARVYRRSLSTKQPARQVAKVDHGRVLAITANVRRPHITAVAKVHIERERETDGSTIGVVYVGGCGGGRDRRGRWRCWTMRTCACIALLAPTVATKRPSMGVRGGLGCLFPS
jgi:hypothetical protein